MVAAALVCSNLTAFGQQTDEQFSIATLNVDGLPQKILVVNVNADGPGDAGTARIGKYLTKKGYDLVMLQEDFNYHNVLSVWLEDNYKMDEWTGAVGLDGPKIDFLHLQNHRFECDGLMGCWKNDLQVTAAVRTPWTHNFGKFSHANDELVTKGFRRYDATLRGGKRIVVYNMHMDASTDADEASGNDQGDIDARRSQWRQLRDYVLPRLDERPVILMGDMNSLYPRDSIQALFIDPINATGSHQVSDTWVEYELNGQYPAVGTGDRHVAYDNGEVLDKILYINPVDGLRLKLESYRLETDYTYDDGTPMGDHFPVSASFSIVGDSSSGIRSLEYDSGSEVFALDGRRLPTLKKGMNIIRTKDGRVRKVVGLFP